MKFLAMPLVMLTAVLGFDHIASFSGHGSEDCGVDFEVSIPVSMTQSLLYYVLAVL